MEKVTLSKIEHKGAIRIKVAVPYKDAAISIIKKIPNRKWSQSKRCWHVPYNKTSFDLLQQHFEVVYSKVQRPANNSPTIIKAASAQPTKSVASSSEPTNLSFVNVITEHQYRVKVFISPQQKAWIEKIKSLPNRAWNKEQKYWSVPKTKETLQQLQHLFGEHLKVAPNIEWKNVNHIQSADKTNLHAAGSNNATTPSSTNTPKAKPTASKKVFRTIRKDGRVLKTLVGQQIIVEKENTKWLRVFVPYDKKGWIEIVKDIPGRKWDVEGKYWLLPYVKDSLKRLWNIVGQQYIALTFEVDADIPAAYSIKQRTNKRIPKFQLKEVQKKAVIAFEEKLMLENKAWRTRKTYKGLFVRFLAYFPDIKPSSISKQQIEQYIIFRKQDNISDSQLNQLINCLNCFFVRILNQKEKVVKLERPRKKKKLPNVFSLEEVEQLLKSLSNLKHKCMLILVYSGGLRRSEVLNLSVDDLNFDRKTLYIRDAKGGKDRYTFFSDIARKYLQEYLNQYRPKYYLFEGQTGGRYSETSLQSIYEKARKKARLRLNVTLHGLRHSFATHLVEKGVPLHAVQELLGHSSIKTTEIYLHISNKFRKELKSPLDDLNL